MKNIIPQSRTTKPGVPDVRPLRRPVDSLSKVVLFLLLIAWAQGGYAQCCLVSSLVINTGYDPAFGTTLPTGAIDPKWQVVSVSPASVTASGGFGGPAAFCIPTGGWAANPPGQPGGWLSFTPAGAYPTVAGLPMTTYSMTLVRCVHLCQPASLSFSLNISDDDFVTDLHIVGGAVSTTNLLSQPPTGLNTYDLAFTNVSVPSTPFPSGYWCIYVTVNNFPLTGMNPHGVDIWGTVTSSVALSLVSETSACTGWMFCDVPAILGTDMCPNQTHTFTDAEPGGTWSWSPPVLAGSLSFAVTTSGLDVTGLSYPGTSTITYTDPCGRPVHQTVNVLQPPTVSANTNGPKCLGDIGPYTLSSSATGVGPLTYAWTGGPPAAIPATSSAPTIAPPASPGSYPYTVTVTSSNGCTAMDLTHYVVNPLPIPFSVTGGGTYCAGGPGLPIGLSGSQTGVGYQLYLGGTPAGIPFHGTGSSFSFGIFTAPGIYTVVATNTTTGCHNNMPGSKTITISPLPTITGPSSVCVTSTVTLNVTPGGGSWTSSDVSKATVVAGTSTTGIVSGVGDGMVTITYTSPVGCVSTVTMNVLPTPIVAASTSPSDICATFCSTLTATYTYTGTDPVSYAWTPGGATTGTVVICPTVTTTYSVSATSSLTGCSSTATTTVTVEPTPVITGTLTVCVGATTTLSATPGGGTWTSSDLTIATLSTGSGTPVVVSGITSGTVTVAYTSPAGCVNSVIVTVNPTPFISLVTAIPPELCPGYSTTLTATLVDPTLTPTYSWSPGGGSVNPLTVTPPSPPTGGSPLVTTYTITATLGLCSSSGTVTVTVDPTPLIIGPSWVCVTHTITLTAIPAGGSWSGGSGAVTVTAGGVVTGVAVGIDFVTYTSPAGCFAVDTLSVEPLPTPAFDTNKSPSHDLCIGGTTNIFIDPVSIASTPACTFLWSSSNPAVATVGPPGTLTLPATTITGVAAGTALICCTVTTTPYGCFQTICFFVTVHDPVVTITSVPPIIPGTIPPLVMECNGATLTASATDGATGLPDPAIYTWAPPTGLSTTTGPVVIATPPATIIYTVTAVDAFGCADSADIQVEPILSTCVCDAMHSGVPISPFAPAGTALFGTITPASFYPAGSYFMNNDVHIVGNVTLNNCVIFIAPGFTIYVEPGALLTLNHCHLFCCPSEMWQGIVLMNTGTPTTQGRIMLADNTMIEDAKIAIDVPSPVTALNPSTSLLYQPGDLDGLIVNSTSAIFNKNIIGIRISNYLDHMTPVFTGGPWLPFQYPEPLTSCYPFVVENTVFTSRDFYNYSTISGSTFPGSYPNIWPWDWANTIGTYGLKEPWTPLSPYVAPYNINNHLGACPNGNYLPTLCNNLSHADKGIYLEDVGYTPNPTIGPYSGIVTGALPATNNMELDMYDNLLYGIYAKNSDITVRNSVFMHLQGWLNPAIGGIGIYAEATGLVPGDFKTYLYGSDGTGAILMGGPAAATGNSFYNCITGMETHEYNNVKAEFATLRSGHHLSGPTSSNGTNGFYMRSSKYYDVQMNHNNIFNISSGITFLADIPAAGPGRFGEIEMNNNHISATYLAGPPTMGEYCRQAITVGNLFPGYPGGTIPGVEVNIEHNDLNHVYNGITVTGFGVQSIPVSVNDNTLLLNRDMTVAAAYGPQTGIMLKDINPGFIQYNSVTGPGYAIPTPPSYTGANYGSMPTIEAIHAETLNGPILMGGPLSSVGCNNVHEINTGFYFGGYNSFSWINNIMDYTAYGMVLNGQIGPQFGLSTYCNDQWTPATSSFWSAPNYQTYTIGGVTTDPTLSRLTVGPTPYLLEPLDNGSEPPTVPYTFGPSIVALAAATVMPCPAVPATTVAWRHANDEHDPHHVSSAEVKGQSYNLYPNPNDGVFLLEQSISDLNPVSAEIWSATGQRIFDGEIHFDGGKTELRLVNKVPGLYLLNLRDSNGQRFTVKFTIE